ncbi:MAG: hypothetical protein QM771_11875 [Nitrospira sp.]
MKKFVVMVFCLVILGGCSKTYEPHLALPAAEVPGSIDADVEIHPFTVSEDILSGHVPYGVLAKDYVNESPSELTQSLTQEITAELNRRRVFRTLSTYTSTPDLVLTGRIERFFEHDRRKIWTLVPGVTDRAANLLGAELYTSEGEVHLEMTLRKPTGEVVGSYVGGSKFNEEYTSKSELDPGDRLNRGLSEAVSQIREKILADAALPKTRALPPLSEH